MSITPEKAKLRRDFSNKLSGLLRDHGMTQGDLADNIEAKTGRPCSQANVSNWHTGRSLPKAKTAEAIAETFDMSVEELLPNRGKSINRNPPFEMRVLDNGQYYVRVDREVSPATAFMIMDALRNEEDTAGY